MNHAPNTANATFSATLCDQWYRQGLRAAFIAPGSRSTPLALALAEHPGIEVQIFHDERAAAFAALGHGLATGTPAVVLCSSGTAGAHFYAAVIEADVAAVPLIVVTADRPPELWGRGAPQTIDQTHLYGTRVRLFLEPGPADDLDPERWRPLARQAWRAATGPTPGPVHLNQSFRDPLTGTPGPLPELEADDSETGASTQPAIDRDLVAQVAEMVQSTPRGVIIAGRGETDADSVGLLAARLGWPVISDHRSGCRDPKSPLVIRHFDSLLRSDSFAQDHLPDVVLRLGEIVSSKATSQWLSAAADAGATVVAGRPHRRHIDPEAIASVQFDEAGFVAALLDELPARETPHEPAAEWNGAWRDADDRAAAAIDGVLAAESEPSEITVAQAAVEAVPPGGALVVASSMPIRDVEWFGPNRSDIEVFSNRGANGIDGTVATALGIAGTGRPTVCLIGDVAFLHDSTSFIGLARRSVDLTIVVTDNDGGGIFSFLPQHRLLDPVEYEPLFGTPHGTDLRALAEAHGVRCEPFDGDVAAPSGVRLVLATSDRGANLKLHDELHAAVDTALA